MCNSGITVLPVTHTRTIPAFTPQPQGVTALCLVLTVTTHERMARLSWPGWLDTYRDKCPALETEPEHGHPSQSNRARRWVTSPMSLPFVMEVMLLLTGKDKTSVLTTENLSPPHNDRYSYIPESPWNMSGGCKCSSPPCCGELSVLPQIP